MANVCSGERPNERRAERWTNNAKSFIGDDIMSEKQKVERQMKETKMVKGRQGEGNKSMSGSEGENQGVCMCWMRACLCECSSGAGVMKYASPRAFG